MRKAITAAFVSLDGVMQAPGGPMEDRSGGFKYGGWLAPLADDPVFGEEVDSLFSQPFDLLLGRRTYDIFAAHWPYAEGEPHDSIARRFNNTRYFATRSRDALHWKGSVVLHDAAKDVARLKQTEGPVLLTQGSSDLIQTLLAEDLIDEMKLLTFPVVLGPGKKLFGSGAKPAAFRLIHLRTSPNGIVVAMYKRAGAVQTGDLASSPASEAELARRNKVEQETEQPPMGVPQPR
ncbi:MAG: dihydrofolate reductase family protein [Bryobacterales bacterium]|nr:dihydrofolate reductase family protein [Bryobacterales bacterium]